MMNGIVIRYVCLLILSLLLQTWNYLIRLSQELPLVSVLPRRFTDVGELFTSLGFFPFMQRDIIQGEMSPDDIRTSGMYDVGNSTTMPFNYGGLLVFNTKTLAIQTGVDLQGKTICIRVSWNNGPWSSWNNFTFNQQNI
jgi:hypothetical protein